MSEYYWCLTHERVEQGSLCKAANRLGPYDSEHAARDWRDRVEGRNEVWQAEDKRWGGEDGQDDEDDGEEK